MNEASSNRGLSRLTFKDGQVHKDQDSHGNQASGQSGMKDLTNGVVEQVSRLQSQL